MRVGFIGLGNVAGKLAGCLLCSGYDLTVRDLDKQAAQPFLDKGAKWPETPGKWPNRSTSTLKVVKNYLCSVHLAALGEAMFTA